MSTDIILVSKEGQKFTTSSKFSQLSVLIYNILQDYHSNEDIAVPHVSAVNLQRIIEFATHHNFIAPAPPRKPVCSKNLADNLSDPWDTNFISVLSEEEVIELILATNYMDMKSLMDMCIARIACSFKEKTIEDVRAEYQIPEEFTPDIEEKLKQEYPWAMEVEAEDS